MRTLQEKYNGIQEGKFSKEHFLAEARMQQPQLVTRFNGYDDAVQILKNKGMIQEASNLAAYKIGDQVKFTNGEIWKVAKPGVKGNKVFLAPFNDVAKKGHISLAIEFSADELKDTVTESINEARLTNKSLTDYRYKPTNEMDKYPYEQILRGIRVELEVLEVLGTPTAEEYSKALAKVSKNLAKDSIYYTNQVAGVNTKVDLHDKMVPVTAKNTVDVFNGMKKAALKEDHSKNPNDKYTVKTCGMEGTPWAVWEGKKRVKGFATKAEAKEYADKQNKKQGLSESVLKEGIKNLIKKVLSEEVEEEVYEMYGYGDVDESTMGDIDQIAQEHDRFEDFVQAVEDEFGPVDDIVELERIFNSTRGIDTEVGKRVTFTNTNDGNKYTGTLVQDLGNGRFTFRAKDGKVYGSEGFGSNWKIEFEASKKATPEIPSFKGTRDALDDLFESVSLKDIL